MFPRYNVIKSIVTGTYSNQIQTFLEGRVARGIFGEEPAELVGTGEIAVLPDGLMTR